MNVPASTKGVDQNKGLSHSRCTGQFCTLLSKNISKGSGWGSLRVCCTPSCQSVLLGWLNLPTINVPRFQKRHSKVPFPFHRSVCKPAVQYGRSFGGRTYNKILLTEANWVLPGLCEMARIHRIQSGLKPKAERKSRELRAKPYGSPPKPARNCDVLWKCAFSCNVMTFSNSFCLRFILFHAYAPQVT